MHYSCSGEPDFREDPQTGEENNETGTHGPAGSEQPNPHADPRRIGTSVTVINVRHAGVSTLRVKLIGLHRTKTKSLDKLGQETERSDSRCSGC